jgi:hypothetical protein
VFFLEGDSFTAPFANGIWKDLETHGRDLTDRQLIDPEAPDSPGLLEMCYDICNGDNDLAQELFDKHIPKAYAPFNYMEKESRGRLADTLSVFRGCQLFLYPWVGYHSPAVIEEELIRAYALPYVQDDITHLRDELPAYH